MTRQFRQDLSALFGSSGRGYPAASMISIFTSWGFAALAYQYYPLATQGGYAGAVAGAFAFSLPVFFLAYWLGAGALSFVVDAKRSCLPGSQRLARRAKFLASALLFPVLVLPVAALAGNPVWRAWVPTVLVIALALLAIAKWRRVNRQGSRPSSPAAPRKAASRHGSWDRQPPALIIRTSLGGMFVRLSARQLIIGAVLLAIFIATAIGLPWLGASERRWAVSILALAAAGLVPSGLLTQISKLTHAQIAELALMPGLGAPAAQRRALCSVILLPPLLWLGIVLLLGSAGLLLEGEPLSSICVLAACVLVIWLFYTVRSLQTLAKRPQRRGSFTFEFLLLYFWVYLVYLELSLLQAHHGYWWVWHWFGWLLIAVGVLISASIAIGMGYVVRRFATAPHPFLS